MTTAQKSNQAFRTISEAANELEVPQHVLRFWETKFSHIKPMKRGGGRRYYRPEDIHLLKGIRRLLYEDGFTIKGVQKVLRDRGVRFVMDTGLAGPEHEPPIASNDDAPRAAARAPQQALAVANDSGAAEAVAAANEERAEVCYTVPRPTGPITDEQRERLEQVLARLVELKQEIRSAMTDLSLPMPNTGAQKLNQRRG